MNNPFNVLNNPTSQLGREFSDDDRSLPLVERIKKILGSEKIVVFIKGTPDYPQCGFSANTLAILNDLKKPFVTFNILEDMDIRQGLKDYSNWPTYPQVYVEGKLIGGNDIVTEMAESGELAKLVNG